MNPTAAPQPQGGIQLAFCGYTNAQGVEAALALARQLRTCEAILDCRGEINRFFYETPAPINDLMMLAVRGAGGPSHYDGGWEELAAALPAASRGFDAIVCQSVDRVGRGATRVLGRENLVAGHGATILYADKSWTELPETTGRPSDRVWRQFKTALRGYDYATANALLTIRRVVRGGG